MGFDPETEGFYLTFEDKTTILVQATKVDKFFDGVASAILADALPAAKQLVELDKLINTPEVVVDHPVGVSGPPA